MQQREYNAKSLYIGEKKKIISQMKDKLGRKIVAEFVVLRAKLYAYKWLDAEKPEGRQCKGIK